MLQHNVTLRALDIRNDYGAGAIISILQTTCGKKSLRKLLLSFPIQPIKELIDLLMKGNGSLVDCGGFFKEICDRNREMHIRAQQAVQALRVLRWRKEVGSILQMMPKEVVKMIGIALWNTRTEIAAWAK